MSSTDWLERLSRATEYRELQAVFTELAREARTTSDGRGLALSIDEAIHRIEQERCRDEDELRLFEQEYDSFKQQQRGVVGWFKRHLPFTETRRLEKQHKDSVADRRAEVLADNLIIARAQMIKEQLLPPDMRRLGHEPVTWRQRLAEHDSVSRLRDYATAVRELRNELVQSLAFVIEVEADINAFGEARFSDTEDRRRKDADLSAARNELDALKAEIQSEESLRSGAVKRLGEMVEHELSDHDPSYRVLTARLLLLETASRRAKDVERTLDQVVSTIKTLRDLSAQRDAIPAERDQLARRTRELRADADDAARRRVHAATNVGEHRARHELAKTAIERAQTAADDATRAYQACLGPGPEVEPGGSLDDSSPVAEKATRTQRLLKQAEEELRFASAAHDAAMMEADRAERDAEKIQRDLDDVRRDEDKLTAKERKLLDELGAARDRLQSARERVEPVVVDYLAAIGPLDRPSSLGEVATDARWRHDRSQSRNRYVSPSSYSTSEPETDLRASERRHERLLTAVRKELKSFTRELADDRKQRQEWWTKRCRELLGEELAAEVCQP